MIGAKKMSQKRKKKRLSKYQGNINDLFFCCASLIRKTLARYSKGGAQYKRSEKVSAGVFPGGQCVSDCTWQRRLGGGSNGTFVVGFAPKVLRITRVKKTLVVFIFARHFFRASTFKLRMRRPSPQNLGVGGSYVKKQRLARI